MRNNNIKDIFESFSPCDAQKQKIYQSVVQSQKAKHERTNLGMGAKLAYLLAASLILAAIAVITFIKPADNSNNTPYTPDHAHMNQAASSNGPAAADQKIEFEGFVLTAYSAKDDALCLTADYLTTSEKSLLTPNVKVLLAQYTPIMSSVPGLPFTIDLHSGIGNTGIEAIIVSAENGHLNKWDKETGIVSSEGQTATIDIGETIYWSPLTNHAISDAITIEAISADSVVGRQTILITMDESGYYYAQASEPELSVL